MSRGDFLLSIDVEDVRDFIPAGHRYSERVPVMCETLLELLAEANAKITFFVTGQVALRYKDLLAHIVCEGHELACHTFEHRPLDKYTAAELEDDLKRNADALAAAGADKVVGFRAPTLSMTEKTIWVYELLSKLGIVYSSSVLPSRSPLYGWPTFGAQPRMVNGVLELPISTGGMPGWRVPFASGIYFRALPLPIIKTQFARCGKLRRPIVSYLHPYDFDSEQERYVHPYTENSRFFQFLMYYNRASALKKLRTLLKMGFRVSPYCEIAEKLRHESPAISAAA
jgi:polysaccharide deacetylase family protein (PEP-CTERM system associated)